MNRRSFINFVIGASAGLPVGPSVSAARPIHTSGPKIKLAVPTPEQTAWQDLEIGMFVHFAPNTWQDREYDDLSTPLTAINPAQLDTDQWAECAQDLGAKYIVFVAKHVGGFCMWQTETTDYGIRNTPWRNGKGDVMADLSRSCRRRGLRLGVYLSPRDDKFGAGTGGRCQTAEKQKAYNALYRRQLTELVTRYGELVEIWFDGSLVFSVGDIPKERAPHAMIFQGPSASIRWVGNEDGFAPYPAWNAVSKSDAATGISTAMHGDPNGSVWLPMETDVSILRPNWFWSAQNERNLLPLASLLEIYYRSVGNGTRLLINIPADRRGLLSAADAGRAREFGDEIRRRFGKSVAETRGPADALTLELPGPTRIDHVVLQEECSAGQRIRAYRLEARAQGNWRTLGTGTAIGHKRVQPVTPAVMDAVRLTATESVGKGMIRRLAVFNTGSAPPSTWDAPPHIWADDAVGEWTHGSFNVDLSQKITAAGQYRLRFVAEDGAKVEVKNPQLLLDGVAQPNLVRASPANSARQSPETSETLILTMPGIGQKVILAGSVQGADRGTLLLRRI